MANADSLASLPNGDGKAAITTGTSKRHVYGKPFASTLFFPADCSINRFWLVDNDLVFDAELGSRCRR
jgi:hypothetical protein